MHAYAQICTIVLVTIGIFDWKFASTTWYHLGFVCEGGGLGLVVAAWVLVGGLEAWWLRLRRENLEKPLVFNGFCAALALETGNGRRKRFFFSHA